MATINPHTTRAVGTILTAAIYNADHENHITNATALNDEFLSLNKSDGNFIVGNGSAWVAESGATARASMGAVGKPDFTADGDFLVGTGAGTYAAEKGAVARTSLGINILGALLPFTGTVAPPWGAFPNGASFNRADYPSWWTWISTVSGLLVAQASKTAGNYGDGNGSTTFTIPDLATANRYLRHADGTILAAGALQTDAFQGHHHRVARSVSRTTTAGSDTPLHTGSSPDVDATAVITDGVNGTPRTASETRPITVAYPFVIFHGGINT